MERKNYHELNAELNLFDENGQIQFHKDKEAAHNFFVNEDDGINSRTVFFHDLEEKVKYLVDNGHWDEDVVLRYGFPFLKSLFKYAHSFKHRFQTFLGAEKFYASYAMRTNNGEKFLERFEDRVVLTAIAHSTDGRHATRLVKHMIEGRFQPATPTFLNAGRAAAGGPTSCYLLRVDDNMESIARAQTDALQLSKRGGGVALSLSNVRESGAPIKGIEGLSSGVVPIMKILEDSFSYADQLGQRQGAGAVYLNIHHPDIVKFLDTKRENADEKIRIKTLSLGIVVPDITFELLKSGEDMYLFSPYDIKKYYDLDFTDFSMTDYYHTFANDDRITKQKISARKLFQTIAEIQFESGYPYLVFEDTVNYYNPAPNVGRISMSNLCVAPETRVLTENGYREVQEIAGQDVKVWNGEEFTLAHAEKTGEGQELITINLSNGASLDVTPYHKFYVQDTYHGKPREVRAGELVEGDKLAKFELGVVDDLQAPDFPHAYTAGLHSAEGTYSRSGTPILRLYPGKTHLGEHIDFKSSSLKEDSTGRVSYILPDSVPQKFAVPTGYSLKSRLDWFAGLIDGDGYGNAAVGIQIASVRPDFLEEVRVMLTTLGVHSKWSKHKDAGEVRVRPAEKAYPTQELYRLVISGSEAQKLRKLGMVSHRVKIEEYDHQRSAVQFVTVESVVATGRIDDTYCLNEPKRHRLVFDGVETGNCSEILQPQTPSEFNNAGEFAEPGRDIACNLGSLNVAKMQEADPETFAETVYDATEFLSNVAAYGDFSSSPTIERGNAAARAIGLGQMNLHGYLIEQGVPYDSEEAVKIWRDYIRKVTYHSILASTDLAEERGAFESFDGSDWQNGAVVKRIIDDLQEHPSDDEFSDQKDWEILQKRIDTYGMYNQHLQAVPPTGSISYINNSTSSIHPIAAKIEIRKEGKLGRVYYPAYGLTNENFSEVDTAYDMSPNAIIDMYAASTPYVDQGQSLTLFFRDTATTRDLNRAQNYAHKAGVKTIYYIRIAQQALSGTEIEGCVSCML